MSIRHSLLAILAGGPTHGYGIKSSFESATAGAWPLNVGQVYTTLARLERDGLIEPEPGEDGPRRGWRLTNPGQAALQAWLAEPVPTDPPPRDELTIKLLLTLALDQGQVPALLARQRSATLERLQQLNRLQRQADPHKDLAWVLLLDHFLLKTKAELDWLALCEQRLGARRP